MIERTTALILDGYDDGAGLDTATSRVILDRVAAGELPDTFRISQPGRIVAFGKRDRLAPGFRSAVDAARDLGYASVIRLPGGRAAAFHEATISFSWTVRTDSSSLANRDRFASLARLVIDALAHLGVAAAIGEIPGEYCPGEFSVGSGGSIKLAGIGQRVVRGAAHVGGVLVVDRASAIREVLVPVYDALDLPWDPTTAGAVADVAPDVTVRDTTNAIVASLATHTNLVERRLDVTTTERARRLTGRYAL